MKVYGLCGGSGSGKGTVAKLFSEYSILSIDTDSVYHALVSESSPCLTELSVEFGPQIIGCDGALDRKKLAELVFSDAGGERHKRLNEITHKHVLERVRELLGEMSKSGAPAVLIDAPMLYESGFDRECDGVICVVADKDLRAERIVARDGITHKQALQRISSQLPDEYLAEHSDFKIVNNGTISELRILVARIAEEIIKNSKGEN